MPTIYLLQNGKRIDAEDDGSFIVDKRNGEFTIEEEEDLPDENKSNDQKSCKSGYFLCQNGKRIDAEDDGSFLVDVYQRGFYIGGQESKKDKEKKKKEDKKDEEKKPVPPIKNITVLKGLNLPKMDLVGKTDAYVKVKIGNTEFETEVISSKDDVEWNETFQVNINDKDSDQIVFEIFDWDKYSDDDLLAKVVIKKEDFLVEGKKTHRIPLVDEDGEVVQDEDGTQAMLEVVIECSDN